MIRTKKVRKDSKKFSTQAIFNYQLKSKNENFKYFSVNLFLELTKK